MSRDEIERCARFLEQGLDLDRETQKRLVLHALGSRPRTHENGCAWWRGAGCTCTEDGEALDLRVKQALTTDVRTDATRMVTGAACAPEGT